MKKIYKRLEKLFEVIKSDKFRQNKGLGNEIGFHIFDYDPEDEMIVRSGIQFIKDKSKNEEFNIQEFDLYDVMMTILGDKKFLDKTFDMEEKKGTDKILEPIRRTMRINQKDDLIVDYIKRNIDSNSIVFLTGVGKAWPII